MIILCIICAVLTLVERILKKVNTLNFIIELQQLCFVYLFLILKVCSKGTFTQNNYFLTAVTLLNKRKDVMKIVYVHSLGIFPAFLHRMNVSRYLFNVPIGNINIFKKRKLSKLCFILTFQVVLITTLTSLIPLRI